MVFGGALMDRAEFSRTSAYVLDVITDPVERERFRVAAIAAQEDLTRLSPEYQRLMLDNQGKWRSRPEVTYERSND
jgi:hypothetical protein